MSLLQTWWLAAGAVGSLVVVVLHMLRPRKKPLRVSSLLLWQAVERQLSATRRKRRLLAGLILLLQLLGIAALSFALARPVHDVAGARLQLAVIVDTSASMAIADAGTTRLNRLLTGLRDFMADGQADRYTLIATTRPGIRFDGSSKEGFLQALDTLPVPVGSSDWEGALASLRSSVQPGLPLRTVILSDGAFDPTPLRATVDIAAEDKAFYSLTGGTPQGNVGIVGFTARPTGGDPSEHQVLLSVANASGEPQEVPVTISASKSGAGGQITPQLLYDKSVTLAPRTTKDILLDHRFTPNERVRAALGVSDTFQVDNEAYLVANGAQTIRILLLGKTNRLLRQGFEAFPQADVEEGFWAAASTSGLEKYDLVVFYDQPVPPGFIGTAISIAATGTAAAGAERRMPQVTWWNRAHPLSRFVDWETVSLGPASPLVLLPGESVLVDSSAGPMLTLLQEGSRRVIRMAIPFEQSDFPFRVAYPVFLHNLLDWANPRGSNFVPSPLPLGDLPAEAFHSWDEDQQGMLRIENASTGAEVAALLPPYDGDPVKGLAQPGAYTWRTDRDQQSFAVSLLDREESDLSLRFDRSSRESLGIDSLRGLRLADLAPSRRNVSLSLESLASPWAVVGIALALLVLVVEGIVYTRTHWAGTQPRSTTLLTGLPQDTISSDPGSDA